MTRPERPRLLHAKSTMLATTESLTTSFSVRYFLDDTSISEEFILDYF